jgi:hypothetical protein
VRSVSPDDSDEARRAARPYRRSTWRPEAIRAVLLKAWDGGSFPPGRFSAKSAGLSARLFAWRGAHKPERD